MEEAEEDFGYKCVNNERKPLLKEEYHHDKSTNEYTCNR